MSITRRSLLLVRSCLNCAFSTLPRFDITKEEIEDLPKLDFTGKFRIISTPIDEVKYQDEIREIQNSSIVGFDTESFTRSPGYQKPCLIQIATPTTALLWRLRRRNNEGGHTMWLSSTLVDILTSSDVLKVGHAICGEDAIIMMKNYHVDMKNLNDTFLLALQLKLNQLSLRKLVAVFLGKRLSKGQSTSNWEKKNLQDRQISYACTDAWASLLVYEAMIRYALSKDTELSQPIDRAWNLLKSKDQEKLLKRVEPDNHPINPFTSPYSLLSDVTSSGSIVYEKTVREEKIRVYSSKRDWRNRNTTHKKYQS